MLVNQRVSAPWSSPFLGPDSRLRIAGFGSFHSPTLLPGFVGECSFVGEFGVSLVSGLWQLWKALFSLPDNKPVSQFPSRT